MPNGDGTGPNGNGPLTGRGKGNCKKGRKIRKEKTSVVNKR